VWRIGELNTKSCSDASISVIIPTLNEVRNIGEVMYKLKQVGCHHVLIVDGNSHDGTPEHAKRLGAKVITQNGKGKGSALRQAFDDEYVNSDIVVVLDADGSMDPGEIPMFVDAIKSGAEVAKGSRFLPEGQSEDMTALRRVGNKILVWISNFMCLTNYTDLCYGYIAFRRDALRRISSRLRSEKFEIETEVCIRAKEFGIRVVEVPSLEHARRYGFSNLNTFTDGFRILAFIVKESLLGSP